MRILYHHRTQGRGAEGNHIVSIVTALRECGHEVDVISPPGVDPFDPNATLPTDTRAAEVRGWSSVWKALSSRTPTWMFELAELAYNVPAWLRLRAALRRKRYDVVLERYASYLIAGAFAAHGSGSLFVLEVNDVSGVANRVRPQVFPRVCAWFERRLIARCDVIHAVSSYLGDRLIERGLAPERLVVAPNGFEVGKLRLSRGRDEMRRRFGLEHGVVVGFAGWFVDWDRLDFLVEVFERARRECPELLLCLVGDGEPMAAVRAMVRKKGLEDAVVHTGAVPRSEVYDHIQMFDIGLLPHSNLFGSPMIMFEMMGLKVPVVAPRLPPIADVHTDASTAALFEPLDVDDCTRQLVRFAKDEALRTAVADAAYEQLVSRHTWRKTAAAILAALPTQGVRISRLAG